VGTEPKHHRQNAQHHELGARAEDQRQQRCAGRSWPDGETGTQYPRHQVRTSGEAVKLCVKTGANASCESCGGEACGDCSGETEHYDKNDHYDKTEHYDKTDHCDKTSASSCAGGKGGGEAGCGSGREGVKPRIKVSASGCADGESGGEACGRCGRGSHSEAGSGESKGSGGDWILKRR
jgi:hypothetical protein